MRLRPEHRNPVWSYDFVEDRTHDGRTFRMLNVIECLAIRVCRRFTASHVVEVLSEFMILHGAPEHIRSDQGPEFVAKAVQDWMARIGARTAHIERASPWDNGYCESFDSKLRDELLDREIFSSLREAEILIETWRVHCNTQRPHSSLGYQPPAPEVQLGPASSALQHRARSRNPPAVSMPLS
jgi:transposase InsO family protein